MNKAGKMRVAVFIAILVILSYFSVGYTYEIFSYSVSDYFIDTDNINDVNIDGSDFTIVSRIMGYGMNTFWRILVSVVNAIVIVIMSLVFCHSFSLDWIEEKHKSLSTGNQHNEMELYGSNHFVRNYRACNYTM